MRARAVQRVDGLFNARYPCLTETISGYVSTRGRATDRAKPAAQVVMPRGTCGGSPKGFGGGIGVVPGTVLASRKTQRTLPSRRAAEGAIRAGQPSSHSVSPTCWNADHWLVAGVGN